jgi:hypothetical protein
MSVIAVRRSHLFGGLGLLAGIVALAFWAPWTVESRGGRTIQVGNMKVTCGLDEQPIVRQVGARSDQIAVECVDTRMVSMPGAGYVPVSSVVASSGGAYTPAVYTRPAPVRTTSAPITRTAASAPAQEPAREEGRSWKKTALIIGGSTGAGAGIGGIAGGKKGALIGAAIGGGSAAIYEAIKRK